MISLRERFEIKVELVPFSTCHWWTAYTDSKGYGTFRGKSEKQRAHRVAYELYNGPIPKGLLVLHKCDNPSCVNPVHLFLGTQADNMKDMCDKGRQNKTKGEHANGSKLTDIEVRKIKKFKKTISYVEMAKIFGTSKSHLHRILTNQSWEHISNG